MYSLCIGNAQATHWCPDGSDEPTRTLDLFALSLPIQNFLGPGRPSSASTHRITVKQGRLGLEVVCWSRCSKSATSATRCNALMDKTTRDGSVGFLLVRRLSVPLTLHGKSPGIHVLRASVGEVHITRDILGSGFERLSGISGTDLGLWQQGWCRRLRSWGMEDMVPPETRA